MRVLKRNIAFIMIFAVLTASAVYLTCEFAVPLKYTAEAKLYIENESLVGASAELFTAKNAIFRLMLHQSGAPHSFTQLLNMIDVIPSARSGFLKITITADDPSIALNMLDTYIKICIEEFSDTFSGDSDKIILLDSPYSSAIPVFPTAKDKIIYTSLSFLAGFILIYTMLVIKSAYSKKITCEHDLYKLYEVPVLAEIARVKNAGLINSETPPLITEIYKTARTNLMFSLTNYEQKIIVFTSANPSEGKSTTCANIALTLARMNASVLIIDADLRHPIIHNLFNIEDKIGLSSTLGGFNNIDAAIHYDVVPSLDIITSGPIPPNPGDLLASDLTDSLLKALSKHYDYILIDAPPINAVCDSQLMNNTVSGIVFIVKENSTTRPDIEEALHSVKMANGKVLGFIKTCCSAKSLKKRRKNLLYYYGK